MLFFGHVIPSNLIWCLCLLLLFSFPPLAFFLIFSVFPTSSFVFAICLSFIFAEEEVENFDVSSLQEEVLRNIEADSFWCMSKLLDGIQVNWFCRSGACLNSLCVCVWDRENARAEGYTTGRANSVCVLCGRMCICVCVSPAYSSSAARIPGVKVFSLIPSLLLGPLSRNETDDEYSHSAPWAEATCLPKSPGSTQITMGT